MEIAKNGKQKIERKYQIEYAKKKQWVACEKKRKKCVSKKTSTSAESCSLWWQSFSSLSLSHTSKIYRKRCRRWEQKKLDYFNFFCLVHCIHCNAWCCSPHVSNFSGVCDVCWHAHFSFTDIMLCVCTNSADVIISSFAYKRCIFRHGFYVFHR